jgi:hypothetical protein
MAQELTEFNERTKDKSSLFDELKRIDDEKKRELTEAEKAAEIEKRRLLFKKVKTEIDGKEESQPKKDTDDWDDIKAYKVN